MEPRDNFCMNVFKELAADDSGATMVEYAILVAFIAAVCIVIVLSVGKNTSNEYSTLNAVY